MKYATFYLVVDEENNVCTFLPPVPFPVAKNYFRKIVLEISKLKEPEKDEAFGELVKIANFGHKTAGMQMSNEDKEKAIALVNSSKYFDLKIMDHMPKQLANVARISLLPSIIDEIFGEQ